MRARIGRLLRRWADRIDRRLTGGIFVHAAHRETLPLGAGCGHCDYQRLSGLVSLACRGPVEAAAVSEVLREHYAEHPSGERS
jgi:hypothetical protein